MKRLRVLALALGLSAASALAGPEPCSNSALLRPGEVRVELISVEGSSTKEGCAIALVDAGVEPIAAVLRDVDAYEEFMPLVKESSSSESATGERLNTLHLNLPFPIRDRHYTVRLFESSVGDGSWSLSWTYVLGSGNIEDTRGSWLLEPRAEGTLVTYRVSTDPGGMIPNWAYSRVSRRTLPAVLRAVGRRVQRRVQQRAQERPEVSRKDG